MRTNAIALLTILLAIEASAQTRTEVLYYTQASSPVATVRYQANWGPTTAGGEVVDIGYPAPDAQGVRSSTINVPSAATIYVTVRALAADGTPSVWSNQRQRVAQGTPPPPPPPAAKSAIVGFALRSNTAALDADFRSGETIPAGTGCAAIETLGNAYLQAGGAGSVRGVMGGLTLCESSAPYVWEGDDGGTPRCASSLTASGPRTLTVTPFDSDGCTGIGGPAVTLTFAVGTAPPPPPPLTITATATPNPVPVGAAFTLAATVGGASGAASVQFDCDANGTTEMTDTIAPYSTACAAFSTAGTKVVRVQVTDSAVRTVATSVNLVVQAPAPPAIAAPGKPACRTVETGRITWPAVPGAVSYRVYRAGTSTVLVSSTTPSMTVNPLADAFSVEVTAIASDGRESARSPAMVVRAAASCG